jgi:hypothetical protein
MATEYGFIYFLSNPCMPGIFKIGFTTNHPLARADQLSASTSCPTPFEMAAAFGTENPHETEQEIHRDLSDYRVNSSREFFRLTAAHALDICRQYGDPCDLFYTTLLECFADDEERKEDIRWKIAHFESQCADPIFWPPARNFSNSDDIPF